MSDDGDKTCPLCAEEMDLTDQQLKPCKCGYEVCGHRKPYVFSSLPSYAYASCCCFYSIVDMIIDLFHKLSSFILSSYKIWTLVM